MKKPYFLLFLLTATVKLSAQNPIHLTIRDTSGPTISRNIYGHFSEDLGGVFMMVSGRGPYKDGCGEALKKIKCRYCAGRGVLCGPVSLADAIGPRAQRKRTVNTTWAW